MQHEFNNRISAQRAILRIVNKMPLGPEELCGLSSKAIDRWMSVNHLDASMRVVSLMKEASSKLFFLANMSQQQVTNEYSIAEAEINAIAGQLMQELAAVQRPS